jgi:hypothetical protein
MPLGAQARLTASRHYRKDAGPPGNLSARGGSSSNLPHDERWVHANGPRSRLPSSVTPRRAFQSHALFPLAGTRYPFVPRWLC